MRIDRLELIACGPFTDLSLDLSQGNHGVHVIWGGNEAGKSSALRAVGDALFGFPDRNPGNFKHPNESLKVGLTLRSADGLAVSFVRRKARQKSLRDAQTDQPLADDLLAPLLGSIDRDLFQKMFGLSHQSLVSGGEEMLKMGSNIGQLLFSAAGSTSNVRKVVASLESDAEALFKPAGRNPRINAAIKALSELKAQLKKSQTPSAKVDALQRDIKRLEDELASLQKTQTALQIARHQLQTLQRLRVPLQQRDNLAAAFEEYRLTRRLSDRFDAIRQEAQNRRRTAEALMETARSRRERLNLSLDKPAVASTTVAHEKSIRELLERSGSYAAAVRDLPTRKIKAEQKEQEANEQLQRIRPDLDLAEARRQKLSKSLRSELDPLIQLHTKLETKASELRRDKADLEAELEGIEQRLSQIEASAIPESVLNLLDSLASLQASLTEWQRTQNAFDDLERELLEELKELRLDPSRLKQAEPLKIPTIGELEQFEKDYEVVQSERRRVVERLREQQEKLEQTSMSLASLRAQAGELPTLDDLRAMRELRERAWQAIRKQLAGEALSEAELEARLAELSAASLINGYEQTVHHADSIADRLRQDAQAVAEKVQLSTELDFCKQRIESLRSEQKTIEDGWRDRLERWKLTWDRFESIWESPKEARRWLDRWTNLSKRMPKYRSEMTQRDRMQEAHRQTLERLAEAWRELFVDQQPPSSGPLDLLKQMSREVERRKKLAAEQQQLLERQRTTNETLARKNKHLDELASDRSIWSEQWSQKVQQLGLPSDASVARAQQVLQELGELESLLEELFGPEKLFERIQQMEHEKLTFESEVRELEKQCGRKDSGASPLEVLRQLSLECEAAKRAQEQWELDQSELKRTEDEIEGLLSKLREAEKTLQELCEEAGCEREEQLSDSWQAFQRLREIEQKQRDNRDEIERVAEGMDLDDAAKLLRERSAAEMAADLEQTERNLRDAAQRVGDCQEQLGSLRSELKAIGSGTDAITLQSQIHQSSAQLEADSREWLRLKTAGFLLRRAMEQFQEQHQGPLLKRAGEIFSRLTLGSFAGLAVNYDDGEPELVGSRGHELVKVSGMSAGTADQLYLSLRLAYLDQWLRKSEPIPLIVDDILITFDDRRAAATLEVLAEFSELTQVILFTHHEHVVELAKSTLQSTRWSNSLFDHPLAK